VELDDGHFVVCWTRESADGGRQAFAQLWSAGGSDLDRRWSSRRQTQMSSVRLTRRPLTATNVIVTFAATAGESFELRAVSLEDSDASGTSDSVARR